MRSQSSDDSGVTLRALIERNGRLERDQLFALLESALQHLVDLHRRGLAHGGVSVDSLVLADQALELRPASSSGEADAQDDVLALGCVLYEALSGRPSFPGSSRRSHAQPLNENPQSLPAAELPALEHRYPSALRAVVSRAMAPRPLRYTDARALLVDLRTALGIHDPEEPPPRPNLRERLQLRHRWRPVLALLGVAAALVIGFLTLSRSTDAVWLEGNALPRLERHLAEGDIHAAADLFLTAKTRVPQSRQLDALRHRVLAAVQITTQPEGAVVTFRRIRRTQRGRNGESSPWTPLGETPLVTELARAPLVLRFELDGHETTERLLDEHVIGDVAAEPIQLSVTLAARPN